MLPVMDWKVTTFATGWTVLGVMDVLPAKWER
jgi:hypothetical protein